MEPIDKSLPSGFGRKIAKNTEKVVSNTILGIKNATPFNHSIKKSIEQLEKEAIEKEVAQQIKLEIKQEKAEAKSQLEKEKQEKKLQEKRYLEQLKLQGKIKKEKAKIAVDIKKYKKNIIEELKKLKGLLDDELLTQEEYLFLKENLMKYL